jgi:hypothetical protein
MLRDTDFDGDAGCSVRNIVEVGSADAPDTSSPCHQLKSCLAAHLAIIRIQ